MQPCSDLKTIAEGPACGLRQAMPGAVEAAGITPGAGEAGRAAAA
jgi:hypothetical protein